jgi:FtsP/CotA-like multicopper oxidase with cupredoxin domain
MPLRPLTALSAAILALLSFTPARAAGGEHGDDGEGYSPRTRHYYIAAQDVDWNYAPTGQNKIKPGQGLGAWGKQTTYAKTRYVEYQSAAFEKRAPQPKHLGLLGPVVRGVVGDTIKIHFKNKANRPYSIHPIGTFYPKADEGANYAGEKHPGGAVKPGGTHTYTLQITEAVGPGPNDPSSILRLYRSHVQPVKDMYRGLIGPIVITDDEHATPSGTPDNVDRSFFNMFMVFDENAPGEAKEGDLMHSINGYIAGNQPGLRVKPGQTVRWHTFAMGSEVDMHTPHWHGNGVRVHGQRKETLLLQPTITISAGMQATNPGTWLFKCNIGDHVTAHMMSLYHVEAK